jgi:hypothetical protein
MNVKSTIVIEASAGQHIDRFLSEAIEYIDSNQIVNCLLRFNGWNYEYDRRYTSIEAMGESWIRYYRRGR